MVRLSVFLPHDRTTAPGRRRGGIYPVRLAAAAAFFLIALASPPLPTAAQSLGFGDTYIFAGCLHISAQSYRGRQGDVNNQDWVTMQVNNHCKVSVKRLWVELRLIDAQGNVYGRRVWLLSRHEFLPPGKSRAERYAIPDPDNRIARSWEVSVLQVERAFKPRRRRK